MKKILIAGINTIAVAAVAAVAAYAGGETTAPAAPAAKPEEKGHAYKKHEAKSGEKKEAGKQCAKPSTPAATK